MSDGEDQIITQYMASLDDDETQNHRVEVNRCRCRSTFSNINAIQSADLQVLNPIFQAREAAGKCLWDDYFAPNYVYPPFIFHWRFRMNRGLFLLQYP